MHARSLFCHNDLGRKCQPCGWIRIFCSLGAHYLALALGVRFTSYAWLSLAFRLLPTES